MDPMIARALEMRRRAVRRLPWPANEPRFAAPAGVLARDTCPPWVYPGGAPNVPPPSPPERKDGRCAEDPEERISKRENALICELARTVGKEATRYLWNPYLFPTPFSQDFVLQGSATITAAGGVFPATVYRVTEFKIPPGWVGVLTGIGVEIPPAQQSNTITIPTVNDRPMKSLEEISFAGSGDVAPAPGRSGVTYPLAPLTSPLPLFHALSEDMKVGVKMAAILAPAADYVVRAVVKGRYWPPSIATRFWNYVKAD